MGAIVVLIKISSTHETYHLDTRLCITQERGGEDGHLAQADRRLHRTDVGCGLDRLSSVAGAIVISPDNAGDALAQVHDNAARIRALQRPLGSLSKGRRHGDEV